MCEFLNIISIIYTTFFIHYVTYAVGNSIVAFDTNSYVGQYASMAFDSTGNHIISYYNSFTAKLKVVNCFEKI
jgi:hypothetical protein